MNTEDIIRMARECGFWLDGANQSTPMWVITQEELERFAELVRKDYSTTHANIWLDRIHKFMLEEREACAKIGDDHPTWSGRAISATIRARGETK